MSKTFTFSLFSCAALALMMTGAASATTVTLGGTAVANQGMKTSQSGATTIDFNGLSSMPSGFTVTGTTPANPLVTGTLSGVYLAPTGDTSTYVTTGTGSVVKTSTTPITYLGFYWGSVDTYNLFSITDSKNNTFNFTGTDLANKFGMTVNGNASYYVNFFADAGTTFKSAGFSSTVNSFEFDNLATATPEPASVAMLAGGLLVIAGSLRRKKA